MTAHFAAFRAILCLSTALMMLISWPLWVSAGVFPRVPFVGGLRLVPLWMSWVRLGIAIGAMVVASCGIRWRTALGVAVGLAGWMVLEDQFRLQPWLYQFLLMGLALAACPPGQATGLCRLFLIALYLHSGLSKLDAAFVAGLGNTFLNTVTGFAGISTATWPSAVRTAAILFMPAWEILIAIGLCFPRTRRVAVIGAVLQHGLLLLILGPWGLKHSENVLVWNVAIMVQVVMLFWRILPQDGADAISARVAAPLGSLARIAMILAAVLPFGERAGLWDTWPSFALYSAHDERVEFLVPTADLAAFPEEIRRHFRNSDTYELLSVNGWSLAERRTPAYPQGRAWNGVAEAIAERYRGPSPVLVIHHGRAGVLTGQRTSRELRGLEAIRRHGESYLLNAHPIP